MEVQGPSQAAPHAALLRGPFTLKARISGGASDGGGVKQRGVQFNTILREPSTVIIRQQTTSQLSARTDTKAFTRIDAQGPLASFPH